MPVIVGPSTITINHNNRFVIAQPDASMARGDDVGFFAQDTRGVSTYGIWVNGRVSLLLNALRVEHFSARHEFTTPELPLGTGALGAGGMSLAARSVGLRLDRTISEGVHQGLRPGRTSCFQRTSKMSAKSESIWIMEIISNTTGFDVVEGPVPRAGRSVDAKASSRPRRARKASSGGC